MSMNNENWVCFDCREVVRRDGNHPTEVPCPSCGQACLWIGDRIRIPAKGNLRGWRKLRESIYEQRLKVLDKRQILKVRRQHELEQQILDVESRPPSPDRTMWIETLRKDLGSM